MPQNTRSGDVLADARRLLTSSAPPSQPEAAVIARRLREHCADLHSRADQINQRGEAERRDLHPDEARRFDQAIRDFDAASELRDQLDERCGFGGSQSRDRAAIFSDADGDTTGRGDRGRNGR